jgi:hypothetical protein
MRNKIDKKPYSEECRQNQLELIDNYKKREAEINADTFSQNESASQSEDRELENMNTESLGSEPASPRRPPPKHHVEPAAIDRHQLSLQHMVKPGKMATNRHQSRIHSTPTVGSLSL